MKVYLLHQSAKAWNEGRHWQVLWMLAVVALLPSCDPLHARLERSESPLPIAEIKRCVVQGSAVRAVCVRGMVTLIDPTFGYFFVQDESGGMRVRPATRLDAAMLGHKVQVDGQTASEMEADVVTGAQVTDRGVGLHPDAQPISSKLTAIERLDGQLVSVLGIPLDSRMDALGRLSIVVRLIEPGRDTVSRLTVIRASQDNEAALVDAEVQFNAVLSATTDLTGRISGFGLISNNLDSLQILQSPSDISALLPTFVKAVTNSATTLPHRVKLRGHIQQDGASGELELVDETGKIPLLNADSLRKVDDGAFESAVQNIAGFVSKRDGRTVVDYPKFIIEKRIASNTRQGKYSNGRVWPNKQAQSMDNSNHGENI